MKKDNTPEKDELREEYNRSDFPGGMVRGKYAKRLQEFTNIVVLKIAQKKAGRTSRSTGSPKKQASR